MKLSYLQQVRKGKWIKKDVVSREGGSYNIFLLKAETTVFSVCHDTVSVYKEYNVKRHYETKHASTFNKLSEADRAEKAKQLEDSLATQQLYFKRAHKSNESITKASLEVALLVAKHSKPFAEGEFVKTCVMKMAEHICPQKNKNFANVCLAPNTVARRIEELSADVRRQLGEKSVHFISFLWPAMKVRTYRTLLNY